MFQCWNNALKLNPILLLGTPFVLLMSYWGFQTATCMVVTVLPQLASSWARYLNTQPYKTSNNGSTAHSSDSGGPTWINFSIGSNSISINNILEPWGEFIGTYQSWRGLCCRDGIHEWRNCGSTLPLITNRKRRYIYMKTQLII